MKRLFGYIIGLFLILNSSLLINEAHAAKMALSPGGGVFRNNCVNALNIIVNTEGINSRSVDAFLHYNPDEIEIIDQNAGIPGIQLRTGNIFQSYPGNQVSNGVIRMTAYNETGFFNGRGTLASLVFTNKPGVTKTSIGFTFSLGQTTDSNVANSESQDVLNATYGGTYTFEPGYCSDDSSPPWIEEKKPDHGDMNVPPDSNVEFVIKDNQSGLDLESLTIDINGTLYTKNGPNLFEFDGKKLKYKIEIEPIENFIPRVPVTVKINAQDLNGNVMQEVVYTFNELIRVDQCPEPEPLRPAAAPPGFPLALLLWLLILLALSLLLNIDLLLNDGNTFFVHLPWLKDRGKKAHFKKRKIKQNKMKR